MTDVATRKDIDDVIGFIKDFMVQVDQRFNSFEKELIEIKQDIVRLEESHNKLLNTIDKFIGRIDKYEIEAMARDAQYERLLAWAKKVSKKTGIPLDVN